MIFDIATKTDLDAMEARLVKLIKSTSEDAKVIASAEANLKISSDALKKAVDANTPAAHQAGGAEAIKPTA